MSRLAKSLPSFRSVLATLSMLSKTNSHCCASPWKLSARTTAQCAHVGRWPEQMQQVSRWCVFAVFLYFAGLAAAQVNPGTPAFSGYDGGQYDTINLQNLNVSLNVPLMSKSGAFPFNFAMTGGGSFVYVNPINETIFPGIFQNPLQALVNRTLGGSGSYTSVTTETDVTCPSAFGSGVANAFSGWYIQFGDGTVHSLPPTDTSYSGPTCSGGFTDQVIDGTGYTLSVTSGTIVGAIYTRDGTNLATNSITDSNGNEISWNIAGATWADTLGLTTLTQASSGISWNWTDVNGGSPTASWTVPNTNPTYKTAYGCTGINDSTHGSVYPLPTSVNFPGSTALGLAWEQTPGYSSDTTGRLAEITLPSGSTVSYNWNPNSASNDGLNCTYLVPNELTRTTSDGTVRYTLAFFQNSGSNYGETDTKIDIGGNKTVYTFTGLTSTGNAAAPIIQVLTETRYYVNTGTVSMPTYASTPTKLIVYCYNSSSPTVSSCPTATVQVPITEVDTFTQLSGMSNYARQQTQYDGGPSGALAHYGNVTYSAQYDFGGTTPVTATTAVYGSSNGSGHCSAISSTVHNKPCTIVTTEGGSTVASSQFTYDSHGNRLKTYVSPNGGSSFFSNSTANSYNTNGTPIYTYDLANNPTGYTYSSSAYTSCGSCTKYPFPTSVTKGGLTTSYTWNGTGGVMLTKVGPNGSTNQKATYGYENSSGTADPWWRVRSVTDPLGNETWITPTVISYETSFEFNNNSIQNVTTTFDGYGRPINVQKQQSPSSSNYDTVSTTYNFSGVNPTVFTSNPCSTTSGSSCSSSYGPTNTYDMFGRLVSSVQSGSNATDTMTYNENDVTLVLGPAASGEHTKGVEYEYDGLGRVKSSCAISSVVSGEVSCGQNTGSNSGILTTTTYSSATGSQTVESCRGPSCQQYHTVKTDGLGRVLTKYTPEGGTFTYTYDQNTSCPSPWQGASGQLASVSDPNGNLLCYEYDGLNRVIGVNADRTTCRWFYYDNSTGYTGTVPSGITLANQYGRLVEATTDACVAVSSHTSATIITDEWFAYDKHGNTTDLWELTPHSTQYYHSNVPSFYGNGVPSSVALASPSLYTMAYGLDGEGRPNTLTDSTANQDIVTGTTFFPATTTPTVSLTGSDNDAYTIDLNTNRIDKFVFTVGSNNLTGTLNWNPNGTLGYLTIADGFNSGGSETCYSNASGSLGYGYDDLARLVEFDCGSGNWGQQFAYDQFDNLTKTVLSGRSGTTWNPTYNTSNRCPSPCTYDSDGNMTADGNDVYGWNEFSKLKWTATSGTPTCGTSGRCSTYDAFGRMVESSNGSAWKEYWYTQAGGKMVMNGTTLSYGRWPTTYGIAETVGTTNFDYLHNDWIGNSRVVSNISNNTVVADQAYTPYGEIYNIFGANNSQYQEFAGTIADLAPSTTTPIMWDTPNRELSYAGRLLSPDPAGAGWNQYAYPTNPNSFSDPSGLRSLNCLLVGSVLVGRANSPHPACAGGGEGDEGGGSGDDGSGDDGDDSGQGGGANDAGQDPFAGAGGPSISPLDGNIYDENVEAVVDGPGLNISGSVGADGDNGANNIGYALFSLIRTDPSGTLIGDAGDVYCGGSTGCTVWDADALEGAGAWAPATDVYPPMLQGVIGDRPQLWHAANGAMIDLTEAYAGGAALAVGGPAVYAAAPDLAIAAWSTADTYGIPAAASTTWLLQDSNAANLVKIWNWGVQQF